MKRTKKALAVVLSLSMLASITPQIVLANSNIPDRYEEVSEMQAIVKDAEVHAYVTRNGGTAELTDSNGVETTFTQGIGYREYTATPADGWVWKGWTYEQLYQGEDLGNRTDYGWGKRYSFSNDGSDWNSAYNGTGQTISVNRLLTKGETVGNKIIYNIYANFNPTINATAGTGGTITDNGVTEVNYGDSKQYDITADAGQDIASVSVDGQDISNAVGKDNFSYTFENVREPHTIDVTFTNELYTVTYTDGVEGQEIFKDEVYSDLKIGDVTPKFKGSLERKDYVFTGWNPEVTNKVAGTAVYTATWADDKNNNGTPDDKEEKFTVTYTDGVDNEEIFKDQSYVDLLSGTKTPKFNGEPKRTGYVFTGWTPEVTETVTQTVTYSAQWAVDENGNDKPDNDEKYTVSYQFINGADDKELPKEVNDMLPKATSYVYGVKVVPVALKADRVETTDGVWLFEGWTPEEIEKLTADTAFTGTWTFAKNAGGINHIPVITAEDKTLTVGDSFDVMAGVTALDKEDGDLTDKIEVINNTVDTSKAGTYTVTYKVTDSNGASVTKTITITVKDKDKEEQPTAPTKPDKGDNNVNDKNNTASKADKYCKEAGARTLVYVSNDNTPACEYADYKFFSFAEDDCLCEAIYTYMITLLARFKKNAGEFDKYDEFVEQYSKIVPYLLKAKEQYEDRCAKMAVEHKDTDYHMVIGSGMLWGEAYDYAMCILEEMQWIKTKSIHAAEYFHGTLELVEEDTSLILFYGEDETRPLMDRVKNFSEKVTKVINIFDTKEVELPFKDAEYRKIVSPMIMYAITERLSCHLEKERNHPLTTRRYYRQMEY